MAFEYLPVDRDQLFLLPPDLRSWLPAGHLVWFVLEVVGRLDTSVLHARHRNDGVGRRSYDPDMLLALLVYAYCTGVRSSRQIERRCESDVAFRVVCANHVPDHTTIARFRQAHTAVAQSLFTDVLVLCFEAGLGSVGVVAVDGTKMGCNASLSANRTRASIEAEVAAMFVDADRVDGAEDRLFGDDRGDELPVDLVNPRSRGERLDAALMELRRQEAVREAAQQARKRTQEEAVARGGRPRGKPSEDEEVAAAEAAVRAEDLRAETRRRERAEKQALLGHRLAGRRPGPQSRGQRLAAERFERVKARADERAKARPHEGPSETAGTRSANTTDPQSRFMKTQQGWVQGYNSQAAVNEHGVVLAAEVTQEHTDFGQCVPMMNAVRKNLDAIGCQNQEIGLVLFDAGYISNDNLTAPGPDRLIATGKARKLNQQLSTRGAPPPDATALEAMGHRLRTPAGRSTYKLRGQLVEPYFGNIKEVRGIRRFIGRGLATVNAEWKLIATTNNILKLFTNPQTST